MKLFKRKQHGIVLCLKNQEDAWWLIGCAMAAIDKSYGKDSVRYREMSELHDGLMVQINRQKR